MSALERWLRLYCPDLLDGWDGLEGSTSASFCRFGLSADGLGLHVRLLQGRQFRDLLLEIGPIGATASPWQDIPEPPTYIESTYEHAPRRQPARRQVTDTWVDSEEEEFV